MPEAPVDEDGDSCAWEDEVWPPGRSSNMQPVSQPLPPEFSAQLALGRSVPTANSRHLLRPGLRHEAVP